MKKHSLFFTFALCAMFMGLQSCDKDENNDEEQQLPTARYNVEAMDRWYYFSFEKGDTIGSGSAMLANDPDWNNRDDWDLAFHMTDVRTNSGESGSGNGGAFDTGKTKFSEVTEAPESGYTIDTKGNIAYTMPPKYAETGVNSVLNTWAKGSMQKTVVPKIFVVKTAKGKYAKIYLKSIYDDFENMVITMEYLYQPDGSRNLSIE